MKKHRKNLLSIIILACVCAGLAAAYFLITATENPAAAGVLFRLGTDSIKSIKIENTYGSFVFEQQAGGWVVMEGGTYRTNPEKINLLLACLQEFAIDRMLPEEKSDYGFDTPQAKVQVTTSAGKEYAFTVGAEAIKGVSVYIKSGQEIMLTSSGMVSQLTGSLAAYRAKDVLQVDAGTIRSIDYYINDKKALSVTNTDYQNWTIRYPFAAPARKIVLNELVSRLRSLVIAGYVDTGNIPKETGLDKATGRMVLKDASGTEQTLEFGAIDGTVQYVRIGGKDDIVQLYSADLDFSGLTPEGVMYIAPLNIGTAQVSSLSIQADGVTDTITLEHNAGNVKAYLNGAALSETDFTSIYYKYIALNADNFEKEHTLQGECAAICTTTLLDGDTVKLSLYRRDEETLYLYVNDQILTDGTSVFYMPESSLTELLYRLQNVKTE